MELVTLPPDIERLYLVRTKKEISMCVENGIPYMVWKGTKLDWMKRVYMPLWLKTKVPALYEKYCKKYRVKPMDETIVFVPGGDASGIGELDDGIQSDSGYSDVATEDRYFDGVDNSNANTTTEITFEKFVGSECHVNIEVLQQLHLLPKFIGDIVECINSNLVGAQWWEGYNKRLNCCCGNMDAGGKAKPNLIILDISWSIPRGVSNAMLQLIGTLTNTCKADLIVTGAKTFFWEYGTELPSPEEIREMIPLGNEAVMFDKILDDLGDRAYGTVIAFGDNDNPGRDWVPTGISCEQILGYHTWDKKLPGYVRRIANSNKSADIKKDTGWVSWMDQ